MSDASHSGQGSNRVAPYASGAYGRLLADFDAQNGTAQPTGARLTPSPPPGLDLAFFQNLFRNSSAHALPKEAKKKLQRISKSLNDAVTSAVTISNKIDKLDNELRDFSEKSKFPRAWPQHNLQYTVAEHQQNLPTELLSFPITIGSSSTYESALTQFHQAYTGHIKAIDLYSMFDLPTSVRSSTRILLSMRLLLSSISARQIFRSYLQKLVFLICQGVLLNILHMPRRRLCDSTAASCKMPLPTSSPGYNKSSLRRLNKRLG